MQNPVNPVKQYPAPGNGQWSCQNNDVPKWSLGTRKTRENIAPGGRNPPTHSVILIFLVSWLPNSFFFFAEKDVDARRAPPLALPRNFLEKNHSAYAGLP
jgi:hypothetical protein